MVQGRVAWLAAAIIITGCAALTPVSPAAAAQQDYYWSGIGQSSVLPFTVPDRVTHVTVDAIGSNGGAVDGHGPLGGQAVATITVTPGQQLQVVVGGPGSQNFSDTFPGSGANGGAPGGPGLGYGGGGRSDVRTGACAATVSCDASAAVVIGGGGGGNSSTGPAGGVGGGPGGAAGNDAGTIGGRGGGGGTSSSGGSGGANGSYSILEGQPFPDPGAPGTAFSGGQGAKYGCGAGGGGGGRFGGGGGGTASAANGCGGGGGGSSFGPAGTRYAAGVSAPTSQMFSGGGGEVTLTYGEEATMAASASTSGFVVGNGSATSTATVTGNDVSHHPQGNVAFFVCGPLPSASGCASGGAAVGTAVALAQVGTSDASRATSSTFTPQTAGTYCFRAYYDGDAQYGPSSDSDGSQCFVVTKAGSATAGTPAASSVVLGDTAGEEARVTGDTRLDVTGDVDFSVCGPLASAAPCSTGGTALGTSALAGGVAQSPAFTPPAPGTYCFHADYAGDVNHNASHDDAGDCVVVEPAASSTTADPGDGSVTLGEDTTFGATVDGNAVGGTPTGDVSFSVCGPLASPAPCATGGTAAGSTTLDDGDATSAPFTPHAAGTYCVRADYAGDDDYDPSTAADADDCFTVARAASTLTTGVDEDTIVLDAANTATATVTGNAAGGIPTGDVAFSLCGPLPGASGCATGGTPVGSGTADGAGAATSPAFTPGAPGTYCVRADYAGDDNYDASDADDTCFTVRPATARVEVAASAASIALSGTSSARVVVTGNATGGAPTGTVELFLCGPGAASCDAGGASEGTVPLSAGPEATASAISSPYAPRQAGTYCYRAVYAGDGDYDGASAAGPGACFTIEVPPDPTVAIVAPAEGAHYALGGAVTASYRCDDDAASLGIESCSGSVADGAKLDTTTPGTQTFTVTARSVSGLTATRTVSYVVDPDKPDTPHEPDNRYTLATKAFSPNRTTGQLTIPLTLPGRGRVEILETANNHTLRPRHGAQAAHNRQPGRNRYTFARSRFTVKRKGKVQLRVTPSAKGRAAVRLARREHRPLLINVWVYYTPTGGKLRVQHTLDYRLLR